MIHAFLELGVFVSRDDLDRRFGLGFIMFATIALFRFHFNDLNKT